MKMYFIDLENINASGLEYIQSITKGDRYYVFYSNACSNISEEVIKRIIDNGASIKLCKVENGMGNVLDFQLSTYMGYIIREDLHRVHKYIIVSGDKGYNVICKFWKEKGYVIYRISSFSDNSESRKEITASELRFYLDKRTISYEAEILKVINNVGNTQRLYANLGKIIRNARCTGILYRRLKPLFLSRFQITGKTEN